MKLRYPAIPLITSDPYFNIWSMTDKLNEDDTRHWAGKTHRLTGFITVDNNKYIFMGKTNENTRIEQISVSVDALSTTYQFACQAVKL